MNVPFPTERRSRAALAVAASTLVLTAAFVGVLAFVRGEIAGFGDRLPAYAVAMGIAFVASLLRAERRYGPPEGAMGEEEETKELGAYDGATILTTAFGVAAASVVIVALAGEGLVYAARSPDQVVTSSFFLYLVAAGLIATGLGYWGLRHWREFAESGS